MGWLYEKFEFDSELNGKVKCERLFGRWIIAAGGIIQSGEYLTRLWESAIRRVPRQGVSRVLLLGLASGGCLKPIHRRFPHSRITAIEFDPAMVELARRLGNLDDAPWLELRQGDAAQIIPRLQGKFDLILSDLYIDGRNSPELRDAVFVDNLKLVLAREGRLIVNRFREPDVLDAFDRKFSRHKTWRFRYNGLALYRHTGRGAIGDPLPEGYAPYRSLGIFQTRECGTGQCRFVGDLACPGMRWHHGPLWFEGYTGDLEPKIEPFGHRRMVIWQPVSRTDCPPGWHRSWVQMNASLTGFADLRETDPYWAGWSEHAQRHRKRWLKSGGSVREVAAEEFLARYRRRDVRIKLKGTLIWLAENKLKRHGERNAYFGAFAPDGEMVGGFAAMDIPEAKQSVHIASFVAPHGRDCSAGVGMVDAWFRRCLDKGYRFADFDLFWTPRDPSSWKGFSRFKGQFGVTYVRYPNPLVRFVGRARS